MAAIGYEHLRRTLGLHAFAPARPARVGPVTYLERRDGELMVPAGVAPAADTPLDHILFALKHEGTNLQILAEAMPHVAADALLDALRATPNGRYLRLAGYLRELFTGEVLDGMPAIGGANVDLFDSARYVTGPARRDGKWRVNFNGLGTPGWCATVERTTAVQAALDSRLPERIRSFTGALDDRLLERTLAWAYLHETRDSFAIERESPSADKARAFVELLRQAHERHPLTEDYLAGLQSATVSNPVDRAVAFRHEQNWLEGPGRGALAVSYIPPPPELARDLMDELMTFANTGGEGVDPIVMASVVSFGFVYVHPFMDGNGRLSRFLYHHALCRAGALDHGLILPVSVAMKKNEADYLRVLQAYSVPGRERWQVEWFDAGQYAFRFTGHPAMYRYWDATEQVAFGSSMAEEALEVELRQEADFLEAYDAIVARVDAEFDVRGSDLSTLVVSCLDNKGVVSQRRRDQFRHRVPDAVFDLVERLAKSHL